MEIVFSTSEGLTGEAALADGLTADPVNRVMFRGAAAAWFAGMADWMNDELDRPGADAAMVLNGIWRLQLQVFASIAGQLVDPRGRDHLVEAMVRALKEEVPSHMERSRGHGADR